jgi:hypothetical protein
MLFDLFDPIKLLSGSHADTAKTGQGCFMNVIAYLDGESHITDRPACVCVVVRPIAIWINDYLTDSERHILVPYIERAMGSATSDQRELSRRARRAVTVAEEMRGLACDAAPYAAKAASAAAAVRAGNTSEAFTYAAKASTYAANACTYAAKTCDYDDTSTDRAYAATRKSIIDSRLRFLDDCLPKAETARQQTLVRTSEPGVPRSSAPACGPATRTTLSGRRQRNSQSC